MKDMFFDYDNHPDKKEYPHPIHRPQTETILESDLHVEIVSDIKGNEIGVKVDHAHDCDLFFTLCGCVEGSSIQELVLNSISIGFEIVDTYHNIVFSKELDPKSVFIACENVIKVTLTPEDMSGLRLESYRMRLSLNWAGGCYELYPERAGLLIIK